jgi:MFS family permease
MPPARLFNRDFVLLWQGQLVSQLGSRAFLVAMMFWTLGQTGSASVMGVLLAVSSLPAAVLGPFGGALADRHSRVRIIVLSDVVRGIVVLGLAGAMWSVAVPNDVRLALLFAVALLNGIVGSVFTPAVTAAIPDLVPASRLAAANSLQQTSTQVAALVGQAVGGVLYALLGAPVLFMLDGVSYLFSGLSETFIRLPSGAAARTAGRGGFGVFLAATREGLLYVWSRRGMRNFMLTAAVFNFIMMPVLVMLPFLVQDFLLETVEWYGFLLASISGGVVLGLLLAGALSLDPAGRAKAIMVLYVTTPLAVVALGSTTRPVVALAVGLSIGAMSGMINVYVATLLQLASPEAMRGRVLGLLATLANGLTPLGLALGGIVGDLTGRNVPVVYGACGVLAAIARVSFVLRRDCREFLRGA